MSLAFHFFSKDTRRLWWAIALSQILLAFLTWLDCWRADPLPGLVEGWGNIVVPASWAILLAMAVLEDPLVGRSQFWITTPCPWSSLLGSKIVCALCWVHLPYFVACWVVVQARGFEPWHFVPALLLKQLMVACAVTAPSLALAASVRNISHFALWVLTASSVAVFSLSGRTPRMESAIAGDSLRVVVVQAILLVGSALVILLQFSSRRTTTGRCIGVMTLAATLVAAIMPRETSAVISSAFERNGTERVTVRMPVIAAPSSLAGHYRGATGGAVGRVPITVPAEVDGIGTADVARLNQISLSMIDRHGERLESAPYYTPDRVRTPALLAGFFFGFERRMPSSQMLNMDRATYARFSHAPVTIEARLLAVNHHRGPAFRMDLHGNATVPGVGRCFTEEREISVSYRAFTVACESPEEVSPFTEVRLYHPQGGLDVKHHLGDAASIVPWPAPTWLSPVQRRRSYFQISEGPIPSPSSRWLVERERLAGAKLEITPVRRAFTSVVTYRASDLDLTRYVVPPAR